MIYNNLGNVLVDVGDQRGALAAYESGRRIAPTCGYVLNGLGNLYTDTGRPGKPVRCRRGARRPAGALRVVQHGQRAARQARRRGGARFHRAPLVAADHNYLQGLGASPTSSTASARRRLVPRRAREPRRRARRARRCTAISRRRCARVLLQKAEVMARRSLSLAPTDKEGMRQLKAVLGENGK